MSIKVKLTVLFLASILIPLLLVVSFNFSSYKKSLESLRYSQLEDVAHLRGEIIDNYFVELTANIKMAQDFYNIRKNLPVLEQFATDPTRPEFVAAKNMLDKQLNKMQRVLKLSSIILVSSEGKMLYTTNADRFDAYYLKPLPDPGNKVFAEGKTKIYFSDLFFNRGQGNAIEMLIATPAYDLKGDAVGLIVFEVDMIPVYKIIQDVTGLGTTGEVLIGKAEGSEVVFLNPLRYDPQAALKRRVRLGEMLGGPIQQAAQGQKGSGELMDYRGKKVVAAWRHIPSVGWGMVAKIDSHEAFAEVARLSRLVMLVLAIVGLLGGIAAFSIANSIAKPIKKLTKGAEVIGSGNLGYKVGIDSRDEIGELSRTFDKMAKDLSTVMASRDELNKEIDRRREAEREQQRLNDELSSSNKKLLELDQRKSDFVAMVSHEFVNPLTIIQNSVEFMRNNITRQLNEDEKQILEIEQRTIERLLRLVTNILDISKIEAGKMELLREKVDPVTLVDEIFKIYGQELTRRQIAFHKDIAHGIGLLWADRDKLNQVIINILNNAIKYTPPKGKITLKIRATEAAVNFEISDTGPGMSKEYFQKIFDKYERIAADRKEGTGLGLPIAKDIVDLHRGNIWVESEIGKGSTFIFTLPRDFRKVDSPKSDSFGVSSL